MQKLHFKPGDLMPGLNPKDVGLEYGGARRYELSAGHEVQLESAGQELCVMVIMGELNVSFGGQTDHSIKTDSPGPAQVSVF